jgi:protein-tyrosine kinase
MPGKPEEEFWKAAAILAKSVRAGQVKGMLVSAASRGEGVTTTSLMIANALSSRCEIRPLLVELDFWKPVLVEKLGLNPEKTLDKVLAGDLCLPKAVQWLENGVAVIAAADQPSPPSKTLAPLAREVMEYAVGRADIVLFDTPPLMQYGAVLSVGTVVPNLLLVVRAGRAATKSVERIQNDLKSAGIDIIGTLLNREKRFVPGWLERLFLS